MPYSTSAPKNVFAENTHKVASESGQPVPQQDRLSYGVVTKVSENNQVRVRLYDRTDNEGNEKEVLEGQFIPVYPQLTEIQLKYGALRPGLQVLVHWKGKLEPNWAIAQIIGDEELQILKKEPLSNTVAGPPARFMMGGLGL